MPLMGTFTFLSASEGKVKLEQSPPSCLPVNKSQKVTGEILFLVSDFPTNSTTIFSFFRKHPFWINCLKMGMKYLGWALQNFQKIWETKYGKKIGPLNFFLLDKWKWRGNDVEMTWSRPLIHWSTDPLIHWSTDVEMTWQWRGLDHWSTDLQINVKHSKKLGNTFSSVCLKCSLGSLCLFRKNQAFLFVS